MNEYTQHIRDTNSYQPGQIVQYQAQGDLQPTIATLSSYNELPPGTWNTRTLGFQNQVNGTEYQRTTAVLQNIGGTNAVPGVVTEELLNNPTLHNTKPFSAFTDKEKNLLRNKYPGLNEDISCYDPVLQHYHILTFDNKWKFEKAILQQETYLEPQLAIPQIQTQLQPEQQYEYQPVQYAEYVYVPQPPQNLSVVPPVVQQPVVVPQQPAPTYTPPIYTPDNTTEYDTTNYVEHPFVEEVRNEEIPAVDTTMVRNEEEQKTNNTLLEPPKIENFVVTEEPKKEKQPKRVKAKIGTKPKVKKVKKEKPEPKEQKTENFNIRVGDNLENVGAQPAPTAQQRSETPQTINVFIPREKKVDAVKTLQENITANIKPQDIQEQISVNFNEAKLLDNIKALLAKQGTNNVKQIIDIVDHIKIDPKVPREHIQLFENLSVQLHELANKIPGNVTFEYNNDDVIKEIATIREKIDNIKIPEHKGDNISVELNHLEAVDEKLKLIEDKLEGFKKPSVTNVSDEINVELNGYDEFAKLISELKTDVKKLQEKEAGIIVESPDIQEITDKLTVLLEEKLKNINSKDNISVEQPNVIVETQDISGAIDEMKKMMVNIEDNLMLKFEQKLKEQKMPNINVEVPQNNVDIDDQISVSNNDAAPIVVEVPAESTPKDYINQVLQDVILQGQQGKNSDLMLNVIQELKAEIQALKEQDVVVEVPVQDISINDEIEVDQLTQEKGKKEEEIIENVYEEVDKPVKKEENEAVIIDEHTEISEPKKEETIQMPAAPTPMSGFMTAQMMPMMMPPVFMPPPMPMATPAQQPQQPIVITQNQSDEEEGNDFWSTFLKVFLVLLLLASIIGLGFLLWKNTQKTTEQKPESKPHDDKPNTQPEQPQVKQEEVKITPKSSETPGPIDTKEGQTVQPVCPEGQNLQLNVDADKVNLGGDVGQITQDAKDAINLENVGVHNKLISESGKVIDTRRIEINGDEIAARDWNGKLSDATVYRGTIQNGKAVINGETYTIANESGKAYSDGAIDLASQTSYSRNSDQTLSTDFGTLKQEFHTNPNNTFTLNTMTEKGTVIASNTVDDISNNATMQNMLKERLNDTSISKGEYNRIMDALDDGKLNNSYLQEINNSTTYSLENSNNIGNGAGY